MDKEKLAPWIEKLNAADPKDYKSIVGTMCKENGMKTAEGWTLLKEAGFDPKAVPSTEDKQGVDSTPSDNGGNPPDTGNVQAGDKPPDPPKTVEKKRVRHNGLKNKKLIVGNKTVEFDADGVVELDGTDAARLLCIPGYEEAL
jgi:hypothetical protein